MERPNVDHGFPVRQAAAETTTPPILFDLLCGALLPIICLAADPVVFHSGRFGEPLLGSVRIAAYAFSAVQIVALVLWLTFGHRQKKSAAIFAGILFAGATFSLLLGIVLVPFSLR